MKPGFLLGMLLLGTVCTAQTVSTKGEPLDKVQTLALLAGSVPGSRVATLVVEQGITFEPRDRDRDLFRKAGADDGVLTAVRVAPHSEAATKAPPSPTAPLERDQILDLLQIGMDDNVLANLVTKRGIGFEPFDDYLQVYKLAGAPESVLRAIRQAATSGPTVAATELSPKETTATGGAAGRLIRVSGATSEARLIYQPKPPYPPLAKAARIQGVVRLAALIGTDGTIEEMKVISGHPLLIKSSMEAVAQWRYRPWLLNGAPVEVATEIDVNYSLSY